MAKTRAEKYLWERECLGIGRLTYEDSIKALKMQKEDIIKEIGSMRNFARPTTHDDTIETIIDCLEE